MRRSRAYSSSCSHVILVYLVAIHSLAAKNRQKSLNPLFLGFKVNQGYQC